MGDDENWGIGDGFWSTGLYGDEGAGAYDQTYEGGSLGEFVVDGGGYTDTDYTANTYDGDFGYTYPWSADDYELFGVGDPLSDDGTGLYIPGGNTNTTTNPTTNPSNPTNPRPSTGSPVGSSSSGSTPSNQALSAVTKGIQDLTKLVGNVLNSLKPPAQVGQPGGVPTATPSIITPELLLVGGLALGGFAFWYLRKKS